MSRRYFRNSLLVIASVAVLAAVPALAAPLVTKEAEPIVITSNRMEAEKLGEKVTFSGNVELKKEGMTVTSDQMVVFYDPGSKNIREIVARGNVVVRKEGRIALANLATYSLREEKIVLTGDARIIENENQVGGQKIILFMRDDRSIVEGGKVLLYQDKLDKSRK
ncbi:MAG TPA: lipopolysaccharide transport periplasmic protein LptA [Nitrospirota bacterium]|nr:lipopolysaccharide transport periplasmic protein LptA [Nitrospirota bacterium]